MKKVMVTGGAGFIGSHVVDACIARGWKVTVIDNFSVGRLDNLKQHQESPQLRLISADVSRYEEIAAAFEGIDTVFHLAARADIVPSIQMPLVYHRANVDGTVNVLEASRQAKVKRFIYAASSSCYGMATQFPTPETAPIQPEYPYALTKFLGEQAVLHWGKVYGLSVASLRFFNVFGPRARTSGTYGAVFGVFLAQKLAGKPLTVVGDGTQTRDFTYVSDIVSALMLAAEASVSGEVFNVGSGGTHSVNSLVSLIGGLVTHLPKRPGEPQSTFADISKIQKVLGWRPQVSFETGVHALLKEIEQWKDAPVWSPETIAEATKDWFAFLSPKQT